MPWRRLIPQLDKFPEPRYERLWERGEPTSPGRFAMKSEPLVCQEVIAISEIKINLL